MKAQRCVSRVMMLFLIIFIIFVNRSECAKNNKKNMKSMILRKRETNAVDFIRLAVMRLIYGIATRIGLGEQISEALGGAFVPPGVDEDDYDYGGGGGGFGLFDREDGDDDY